MTPTAPAAPITSPYDESRTRLTVIAAWVYLAVMTLGWLGVLPGVSLLLIPVLLGLCWRPLAAMATAAVRVRGRCSRGRPWRRSC